MTVARSAHGCVVDGKLYAVGGFGAGAEELDTAEVRPADRWLAAFGQDGHCTRWVGTGRGRWRDRWVEWPPADGGPGLESVRPTTRRLGSGGEHEREALAPYLGGG